MEKRLGKDGKVIRKRWKSDKETIEMTLNEVEEGFEEDYQAEEEERKAKGRKNRVGVS